MSAPTAAAPPRTIQTGSPESALAPGKTESKGGEGEERRAHQEGVKAPGVHVAIIAPTPLVRGSDIPLQRWWCTHVVRNRSRVGVTILGAQLWRTPVVA